MSYVAKIDKWGNEIWHLADWRKANQEQGFATKFKSLEQIIEAELDEEEAKRLCTTAPNAAKPATARETSTTTTSENRPTSAPITSARTVTAIVPISMTRRTDMGAVIDITPLEQSFSVERQDFDTRLYHIQAMTPELMRAKTLSDALIDQGEAEEWAQAVSDADTAAKTFLKAYAEDPEENRIDRTIKELVDARRAQKERVTRSAMTLRAICSTLSQARLLAVNQKAERERRALEAEQQRIAERERAEEVLHLKAQADAEADEAEKRRLYVAALDVEKAPIVPAAVPVAAFAPPKTGVSGTKVWYHTIENWDQPMGKMQAGWGRFLEMLRTFTPSIAFDGKTETTVIVAGLKLTVSSTKLKGAKNPLGGMQVREGMETRNYRK